MRKKNSKKRFFFEKPQGASNMFGAGLILEGASNPGMAFILWGFNILILLVWISSMYWNKFYLIHVQRKTDCLRAIFSKEFAAYFLSSMLTNDQKQTFENIIFLNENHMNNAISVFVCHLLFDYDLDDQWLSFNRMKKQ